MPREACSSILHMLFCLAFVRKPYLSIIPGFIHPGRSFPWDDSEFSGAVSITPVAPSFSGLQHGAGLITIFPSPWQRSPCILTMIWTDLNLGVEGCQPGHETKLVKHGPSHCSNIPTRINIHWHHVPCVPACLCAWRVESSPFHGVHGHPASHPAWSQVLSPDVSQGLSQQGPDGSSHSIASCVGSFSPAPGSPHHFPGWRRWSKGARLDLYWSSF